MKKGLAMETTVILIIVIVSFIILFPFISKLLSYALGYAKGGVCQASAEAAALRIDYGWKSACKDVAQSPIKMRCPRRHIIAEEKSAFVVQDGEKNPLPIYSAGEQKFYSQYSVLNGEIAETILAEELRSCWDKLGKGNAVLLEQAPLSQSWLKDTRELTACHVCAEISFAEADLSQSDLGKYIREENIPGKELTYFDFLNDENTLCETWIDNTGKCWEKTEDYFTKPLTEVKKQFGQDEIWNEMNDIFLRQYKEGRAPKMGVLSSEETYAIVYVRKRFDTCQQFEQTAENPEFTNFVYVVPVTALDGLCSAVVS